MKSFVIGAAVAALVAAAPALAQTDGQGGQAPAAQGQGGAGQASDKKPMPQTQQQIQQQPGQKAGDQQKADDLKKADDPKKADAMKKADDPKKAGDQLKADDPKKADDLKKVDDPKKATDQKKTTDQQKSTAGAGLQLDAKQKTTIREGFRKEKVDKVTNVNFSIAVGVAVPRTVRFHPVPVTVIETYPAWRGYLYFVAADGDIIVVDPDTYLIVAVLEG